MQSTRITFNAIEHDAILTAYIDTNYDIYNIHTYTIHIYIYVYINWSINNII